MMFSIALLSTTILSFALPQGSQNSQSVVSVAGPGQTVINGRVVDGPGAENYSTVPESLPLNNDKLPNSSQSVVSIAGPGQTVVNGKVLAGTSGGNDPTIIPPRQKISHTPSGYPTENPEAESSSTSSALYSSYTPLSKSAPVLAAGSNSEIPLTNSSLPTDYKGLENLNSALKGLNITVPLNTTTPSGINATTIQNATPNQARNVITYNIKQTKNVINQIKNTINVNGDDEKLNAALEAAVKELNDQRAQLSELKKTYAARQGAYAQSTTPGQNNPAGQSSVTGQVARTAITNVQPINNQAASTLGAPSSNGASTGNSDSTDTSVRQASAASSAQGGVPIISRANSNEAAQPGIPSSSSSSDASSIIQQLRSMVSQMSTVLSSYKSS